VLQRALELLRRADDDERRLEVVLRIELGLHDSRLCAAESTAYASTARALQ
jgi:hypothetical protein